MYIVESNPADSSSNFNRMSSYSWHMALLTCIWKWILYRKWHDCGPCIRVTSYLQIVRVWATSLIIAAVDDTVVTYNLYIQLCVLCGCGVVVVWLWCGCDVGVCGCGCVFLLFRALLSDHDSWIINNTRNFCTDLPSMQPPPLQLQSPESAPGTSMQYLLCYSKHQRVTLSYSEQWIAKFGCLAIRRILRRIRNHQHNKSFCIQSYWLVEAVLCHENNFLTYITILLRS